MRTKDDLWSRAAEGGLRLGGSRELLLQPESNEFVGVATGRRLLLHTRRDGRCGRRRRTKAMAQRVHFQQALQCTATRKDHVKRSPLSFPGSLDQRSFPSYILLRNLSCKIRLSLASSPPFSSTKVCLLSGSQPVLRDLDDGRDIAVGPFLSSSPAELSALE